MNFYAMVYDVVKQIPRGKVTSYGVIARLIGRPNAARVVGYALHVNPDTNTIPCHRVVAKDGSLSAAFAFGGIEAHKMLLIAEGVKVNFDNKVDMAKYGWMI